MPRNEVSKDFMPVSEAAKRLGLERALLVWAAGDGLLSGRQDDKGNWYLDRKSIEAGQLPLESQFPHLLDRDAARQAASEVTDRKPSPERRTAVVEDTPDFETKTYGAPPLSSGSDSRNDLLQQEIRGLKSQIRDRDELVADLARSLARIGESMAGQLDTKRGKKQDDD